ncbi:hypothetical protein [Streptomyces sp. NRRL S-350]|uniref:hypothetical protein n=1 Tax=Streptomyces sp. NRRL S-350 TaxID=1463902 RepID=UPI0004C04485|nr:hypothetical protein [Streptomyces sp. NRRL S-350]
MTDGGAMNARIEDARPPRRLRRAAGRVARWLACLLLLVAGAATAALGFSWFVDAYHESGAYLTAPSCGTAEAVPGADCLRHEAGKVRAGRVDNSGDSPSYELTVSRESAPSGTYTVGKAFYDDVEIGTDVELAVWRGRVVVVSYHGHRADNPSTYWLTSLKVALLVGLGSALTAYGVTLPRGGAVGSPAMGAAFVVVFAFFGSLLFLSTQWPFAVTLGVPVLAWVLMTAAVTAIAWDG